MARWRIGDATYLVDEYGEPVARDDGTFRELPLVVGEGAADDAIVMIRTLERYPALTPRPCRAEPHRRSALGPDLLQRPARAVARERRRAGAAAARHAISRRQQLLDRDVTVIDMRVAGMVSLKLGDLAIKARDDAAKAKKKMPRVAADIRLRHTRRTGRGGHTAMMTDAMTARLKPVQPGRPSLVSVLDIGSTKICCVIARLTPRPEGKALKGRTHIAEVIGFGYGPSSGIKSGVITDLDKAEQAIRTVVGMAERAAGLTRAVGHRQRHRRPAGLRDVLGHRRSGRAGGREVRHPARAARRQRAQRAARALDHPCAADRLRASMARRASGSARPGRREARRRCRGDQRRNAGHAQYRTGAQPLPPADRGAVATPYASGLATLVDDEAQLGVACIDFGGATTTVVGLRRWPSGLCRCHRHRRPSPDARYRPPAFGLASPMPSG